MLYILSKSGGRGEAGVIRYSRSASFVLGDRHDLRHRGRARRDHGLRKSDVVLDAAVPHIIIKRHDLRRVKTDAAERKVPLVGEALWAAEQGMKTKGDLLFPAFALSKPDTPVNVASASAALNKWLKDNKLVGEGQTIHSFRHAMRDRLRDVGAPIDVADAIGGWARQSVGDCYERGHSLEVLLAHIRKVGL